MQNSNAMFMATSAATTGLDKVGTLSSNGDNGHMRSPYMHPGLPGAAAGSEQRTTNYSTSKLPPPPLAPKPRPVVSSSINTVSYNNGAQPRAAYGEGSSGTVLPSAPLEVNMKGRPDQELEDSNSSSDEEMQELNSWTALKEDQTEEEIKRHCWRHFEEGRDLLADADEESSEAEELAEDSHTTDESGDEVWQLSNEQREYYRKQFLQVNSDANGLLSGQTARAFFEKSHLPTHELSAIWKLSDVDLDGRLNINEFCVAMHLVVLRRQLVDLPATLPNSLRRFALAGSSFNSSKSASLDQLQKATTNPRNLRMHTSSTGKQARAGRNHQGSGRMERERNYCLPSTSGYHGSGSSGSKQWTEFDSPTEDLLVNVSSPPEMGHKPVNFDIAAPTSDNKKILQPIAQRPSPSANSTSELYKLTNNLAAFQINGAKSGLEPPLPPRRPQRITGHTRSSSLDLNHLGRIAAPPGPSKNPNLGDQSDHTARAFHAYKKGLANTIRSRFCSVVPAEVPDPSDLSDPEDLYRTIQALRDRSRQLEAINETIIEELAAVIQTNQNLSEQLKRYK